MFYAALNVRADLDNGNRGFRNSWEIARFETVAARDAFVLRESTRLAKPVTRREADAIFRGTYECVGETPPKGGLFGDSPYADDRFYREFEP